MVEDNPALNRRKVLKNAGASAAVTVSSSYATATDGQKKTVLDRKPVKSLLSVAGDPPVHSVKTTEKRYSDKNSLIGNIVETNVGHITYARFDRPSGGEFASAYYNLDTQKYSNMEGGVLPPFGNIIEGCEISLLYENGNVHIVRTATEEERTALSRLSGSDEFLEVSINVSERTVYGLLESGQRVMLPLSNAGSVYRPTENSSHYLQNAAVSEISQSTGDLVEVQGSGCFKIFGPCPKCIAGTVACAACTGACPVNPKACAVCLILTCGYTGGACGCCAQCLDSLPDTFPCK